MSTSSFTTTIPWIQLPPEMKLSVIDLLEVDQVKNLAFVSRSTRALCVPAIFKTVNLKSYDDLLCFLRDVPLTYYPYIRRLDVCTRSQAEDPSQHEAPTPCPRPHTEALITLLSHCVQLERLSLHLVGSLAKDVIAYFASFHYLNQLSINNCGDEDNYPISERLVVSIAASVPRLETLSVSRISRSAMHAPELIGAYPYVPVVAGDDNIEDHPLLGSDLSLPSLLRIPTLRKLVIRDTHLGDLGWATVPVACPLEVLDLGSSYHETEEFNRLCTERIIANVGSTIDEFTLSTAFGASSKSDQSVVKHEKTDTSSPPLRRLRNLHLTPLVPVDNVLETLTTLSESPIERISVQCLQEDIADICTALQDFLTMRVQRGFESGFYQHLHEIQVTVTESLDALDSVGGWAIPCSSVDAAVGLQEYCRDIHLSSIIDDDVAICKAMLGGIEKASLVQE